MIVDILLAERIQDEDTQRESKAELTSNEGFSVVAPMSVIVRSRQPQQSILLSLVEWWILVDEEDGATSSPAILRAPAIASRTS